MANRFWFPALPAAAVLAAGAGLIAAAPAGVAAVATDDGAGARLGALIRQALREDGPLFNAEERAVIERACGYPAGSWDGFEANMADGGFHCTDGRRVDSPEVRAVMEAAAPRIGARVGAVMARPEIAGAIDRIAREASAEALRGMDQAEIAREASEAAQRAVAEAQRARAAGRGR